MDLVINDNYTSRRIASQPNVTRCLHFDRTGTFLKLLVSHHHLVFSNGRGGLPFFGKTRRAVGNTFYEATVIGR